MSARAKAAEAFRQRFGTEPDGIAFAPGRVNLIGEHVDYNDGLVLPMPIAQGTAVAWKRRDGELIEIHAGDIAADDVFRFGNVDAPAGVDWRSYCRGMVTLSPVTPAGGLQMAIAGDLERGAGLSSSASLCIAMGRALADAADRVIDPAVLARAAQQTEHEFAGVACGIMDQMAIAAGNPGQAMLLDCRDLSHRQVNLPPDWAVVVVSSGVQRGLVEGEYNLRRRQCETAAKSLGVKSLRDATPAMIAAAKLTLPVLQRARHVVSEIGRVQEAVKALAQADMATMRRLLREGHHSLRDQFEVSIPVIDDLVQQLEHVVGNEGGARMTGAGFGGSVVVVAQLSAARRVLYAWPDAATLVSDCDSA